ncbi:tRNA modification GTPase [Nannocystis punicea]|uniref:tRNA modification GTPase MnmE n=1 Tax=Nannocystis punicea TaxID=2995304 RepID=A0ABY7H3U0_9BACT|nr:tRNA modification GTPase [Nannocystis poenicansa]WAS93941.1 tRNA modification GTPase [Nannocystis poenicansa]
MTRPRASQSPDSTIVGVATGTPDGGVAIVRVSGPEARALVEPLVETLPSPRTLARRLLRDGEGAGDEALVAWMPGPRSFTGEDVIELHVHAGARNVGRIVSTLQQRGARAAGPGEFTRRAFEHGRLSLEQAEGIAALIAARTSAAIDQARRLVAGELGREVEALRTVVGDLRAEIEANLDFPEDVAAGDVRRWREELMQHEATARAWLRSFAAGQRARERARVVIAGPPNAGKSALFNALLGRSRAIVSPTPGTTRDYVEAELQLDSLEVVVVDTAGLRHATDDSIEHEGIGRSREQIAGAELVLWLEPADVDPLDAAVSEALRVESKRDLGTRRPDWLGVSVQTGEGLEGLRVEIARKLRGDESAPWIGLARHRDRASEAASAMASALAQLERAAPLELVAFELGVAERQLAEITGRDALGPVGEEVLGRIFSQFCIGK